MIGAKMNERKIIQIDITLRKFYSEMYKFLKKNKILWSYLIVLFSIVFYVLLFKISLLKNSDMAHLFILITISPFLAFLFLKSQIKKLYKNFYYPYFEMTFDQNEIKFKKKNIYLSYKWEKIKTVFETSVLINFVFEDKTIVPIVKNKLNNLDYDCLIDALKKRSIKIKKKKGGNI